MHRHSQFGMRENPASDRRHGSRLVISTKSIPNCFQERNAEAFPLTRPAETTLAGADAPTNVAPNWAAIVGKSTNNGRLLTVHEVAELLRVPVSWVYGRTRKRSLQRLPGYRLGKYWRFREEEIHAWVERQCGECHNS